jgi:Protein of unknown function (DUF2857)
MARDTSIVLGVQSKVLGEGGASRYAGGLRMRLPALALAVSQALAQAIARPDGQSLLLQAGFTPHAVDWLRTLSRNELQRACAVVEVVVPPSVFNAQAAIKHLAPDAQGELDPVLIEDYLINHGAHAAMMLELSRMSEAAFRERLLALDLPVRIGRPVRLTDETQREQVLDTWAALQRTEQQAIRAAALANEPYAPTSKAELYLMLHYQYYPRESLGSLYNVLCDVPPLGCALELGSGL